MPTVLTDPGPLSERARAFLRAHASVIEVDRGPSDARCRALLDKVFSSQDDGVIAVLRQLQERYSGLSYYSPYLQERIFFAPVLEPEVGDERIEFLYAIHPTGSARGGSVLRDGTVLIGTGDDVDTSFPSLDHFIEHDAELALFKAAES